MNIKTICYFCSVVMFVFCLPAFGAVYSTTDILNGAGNFEFNGGNGPWTFGANGGSTSAISSEMSSSGTYSWKAGPSVNAGNSINIQTSVSTFANRLHKIVLNARAQVSSPSWARAKLNAAPWDSNMNFTSNVFGSFAASTVYSKTEMNVATHPFGIGVYSNSADDTLFVDNVAVYRERCFPEANSIDSLGGVLPFGQKVTVTLDCNQGTNASGYTKNFDPDITVSSPYAIIHSYQWISDTQIQVELTAFYGGNIILTLRNESSQLEGTHIMTSTYPAGPFTFDSDEFPIIFLDAASSDSSGGLEFARTCGANYLHRFGHGEDITALQSYLGWCQERGMRVFVNLSGVSRLLQTDGLSSMQQVATAVKDHSAFGFWFLCDEPEARDRAEGTDTQGLFGASDLEPYYTMLKTLTPNVPVVLTHSQFSSDPVYANWWDYGNCQDVFMTDRYPVHDEVFPTAPIDSATNWIRTAMAASPSDKIIPSLQLHNTLSFGVGHWPYITEDCRYPNTVEIRYWSYASVIQGCRGLAWYSYYRSQIPNGPDYAKETTWMENVFRPVGQEVRKLSFLAAPFHQPEVILNGDTGTNDLYMAVWPRSTGYWVVLVNGTGTGRSVTINTSSKIMDANLKPWGMTREVEAKVVNGQMKLYIQPWETFIWTAQFSADTNKDERVDFSDLQEMSMDWLESSN
jgi:hypothetical protein